MKKTGKRCCPSEIATKAGINRSTTSRWEMSKKTKNLFNIAEFGCLVANAIGADNIEEAKERIMNREQTAFILTLHGYNCNDFLAAYPGKMEFNGVDVYRHMGI